jgi:hypothetical protein
MAQNKLAIFSLLLFPLSIENKMMDSIPIDIISREIYQWLDIKDIIRARLVAKGFKLAAHVAIKGHDWGPSGLNGITYRGLMVLSEAKSLTLYFPNHGQLCWVRDHCSKVNVTIITDEAIMAADYPNAVVILAKKCSCGSDAFNMDTKKCKCENDGLNDLKAYASVINFLLVSNGASILKYSD